MKIVQLTAENVKRLLAVQITPGPDGNMIVIGGENAQGKTSLLDAIAMAIGGGDQIPERPIREGSSKASIVLETEEYTVTRSFTAKGTSLVVKNKEGVPMPGPQELLNRLTNRISFDPLAFTRMDDKKQAETLRRLVGIDFSALDTEHAGKYAERTATNRAVKEQQVVCDRMQRHPDAPKEIAVSDPLLERLGKAQDTNRQNDALRERVVSANDGIEATERLRKVAQANFEEAKRMLQQREEECAAAIDNRDKLHAEAQSLVDVDTAPIMEEIRTLETVNARVRENQEWQRAQEKLVSLTKAAEKLTERLAAIDKEKEDTLSKAKFPVDGLSFTPDGITFNGIPFSQASGAEQLRVSVAMGFALAPALKVALIRDGSLLDDKNLALVAEIAEKAGGQCWIERVSAGEEVTVVIEDGQVKEDRTPAGKSRAAQAAKSSAK